MDHGRDTGRTRPERLRAGRSAGGNPAARPRTAPAQLAQEFEAMLLLQMVRQMRQSLLEEDAEGEGLGRRAR